MKNKLVITALLSLLCAHSLALAQSIGDYLLLQNIGLYKLDKPEKHLPGEPPSGGPRLYDSAGVVAGAGHFPDHMDKTYEVMYLGGDTNSSPTVQVTQHAGIDSDRWLLHEVDTGFRDKYGITAVSYYPWQIDGLNILINAVGGREYRWLSGNKVIVIEYHGSLTQKPEPLEVVKAYLVKHPSTLPSLSMSQLRSVESKTQWIKDEMDRRLWLCDKWFNQLQLQKADQKTVLQEEVKSMNVFLDYREKYFGISAKDEKNLLSQYLMQNDSTDIQAKLMAYKTWWSANKEDSITLP